MLGLSLLGLLLAGIWQGEIHSHDSGSATHTHERGSDAPVSDPSSDGSAPEPLHVHEASVTVVMAGPPAVSTGLPSASATWMPDDPTVYAPPTAFNTPHRPPIV